MRKRGLFAAQMPRKIPYICNMLVAMTFFSKKENEL